MCNFCTFVAKSRSMKVPVLVFLLPKHSSTTTEKEEVVLGNNLDAKLDSAVALVQGGKAPMQGIFMLREVLEEDPENIKALQYLGVFSIQSGQYENAVKRFEQVLSLDSSIIDAYYYLGHAYANSDQKTKAISNFERYKSLVDDPSKIKEVEKFIEELNK